MLIKLSNKGSPILPIYYLGCDFNIKILKMIHEYESGKHQSINERERERRNGPTLSKLATWKKSMFDLFNSE